MAVGGKAICHHRIEGTGLMSHYKLKGTSGSVINQSFPFRDALVLGSSPDSNVQIDETGVSPHHAEIRLFKDTDLLLKDLGSETGTLLNGEPVTQALLESGDEIRIGTCRWLLQAPGLRPKRILTTDAVKISVNHWPRRVVWTTLVIASAIVFLLKWKPQWLDLLLSFL